jgi:hypothetical protein
LPALKTNINPTVEPLSKMSFAFGFCECTAKAKAVPFQKQNLPYFEMRFSLDVGWLIPAFSPAHRHRLAPTGWW